MISDFIAENLEKRGMFRRAATRWAEVLYRCTDDNERKEAKRRIELCYIKSKRSIPDRENFSDVSRAASETQRRMGIIEPRGISFRLIKNKKT